MRCVALFQQIQLFRRHIHTTHMRVHIYDQTMHIIYIHAAGQSTIRLQMQFTHTHTRMYESK